jgi:2-methylcitrate dehydratase PrpD
VPEDSSLVRIGCFAAAAVPPAEARARAAAAILDTVGVTLAGVNEPASRIVRRTIQEDGAHNGACTILGAAVRTTATGAALANGTAAHALDYDDMCFVSLAHPSAPLVAAILATAELTGASGRSLLDAYVVGFEVEGRLGAPMNPRHYQRGWHCTSTIGTVGAAAACARLCVLGPAEIGHAVAIAASEASGLKENFGTMVKPLHAGLAARNGVLAALLARDGLTASESALEGRQGFMVAMDGERTSAAAHVQDLGSRWDILDTGITVKLYPSCAGTHPTVDAVLQLRREHRITADDVQAVEVDVDSVTPTVLIHDRPSTGLEGKFSMQFCVASALVHGRIGVDTFDRAGLDDPHVRELLARISMQVDPSLDGQAPPLTQARVRVRLREGRVLTASANGARGYPANPASDEELAAKFLACARAVISPAGADRALDLLQRLESLPDAREVTAALGGGRQ